MADATTSAQALANLQAFQSGVKNPADFLASQQRSLGVNAAQQNVGGLRGAVAETSRTLSNVAPGVMGRTANSLVTSAQANRQIQNEQAPIASQLSKRTEELGTAQQDLNQLQQQAREAANMQYEAQQQQGSYLQNIYNTLFQKEQAQQAYELEQQKLAEQRREADLSASSARAAAAAASPSFNLGGGGVQQAAGPSAEDQLKQRAQSSVLSLLGTKDKNIISRTIDAIKKSAGYGSPYDKLKLQLLQSAVPDYFKSKPKSSPGNYITTIRANEKNFKLGK